MTSYVKKETVEHEVKAIRYEEKCGYYEDGNNFPELQEFCREHLKDDRNEHGLEFKLCRIFLFIQPGEWLVASRSGFHLETDDNFRKEYTAVEEKN